jgi:hypothetical protein
VTAQIVQIVGSLLVLAAFAASQAGKLDAHSVRYLVLNLLGSGVLAIEAALTALGGFVVLVGVGAFVWFAGLRPPPRGGPATR